MHKGKVNTEDNKRQDHEFNTSAASPKYGTQQPIKSSKVKIRQVQKLKQYNTKPLEQSRLLQLAKQELVKRLES